MNDLIVKPILEIQNLTIQFKNQKNTLLAVDNLSLNIAENEFVGLVGESGSGKSVTALSILNLLPQNALIKSGQIFWQDQDILKMNKNQLKQSRGGEIGLIFQNPLNSLNPVFTIGNQLIETIMLHRKVKKAEAKQIAIELLKKVNIPDPAIRLNHYPHQFSLGMCQRIMIALTISMQPKLILADEPTASLDVTIQAQILELLAKLRQEYKMSLLLISHDLGIIAQYTERVYIMYLGQIVESGKVKDIFENPLHPYTQALLNAIPTGLKAQSQKDVKVGANGSPVQEKNFSFSRVEEGLPPSKRISSSGFKGQSPLEKTGLLRRSGNPCGCPNKNAAPTGETGVKGDEIPFGDYCKFLPRCAMSSDRCKNEQPILEEREPDHYVRCF